MTALILKSDGQIRLTYDTLRGLSLTHLMSGLDECTPEIRGPCAVATDLTGYTEWTTIGPPRVTLGWDWELQILPDRMRLQRVGEPRSNLMLYSAAQTDLGHMQSSALIADYIDVFDWQEEALSYIVGRYAFKPASDQDSAQYQPGHIRD